MVRGGFNSLELTGLRVEHAQFAVARDKEPPRVGGEAQVVPPERLSARFHRRGKDLFYGGIFLVEIVFETRKLVQSHNPQDFVRPVPDCAVGALKFVREFRYILG